MIDTEIDDKLAEDLHVVIKSLTEFLQALETKYSGAVAMCALHYAFAEGIAKMPELAAERVLKQLKKTIGKERRSQATA
jgi:hypothetical protein